MHATDLEIRLTPRGDDSFAVSLRLQAPAAPVATDLLSGVVVTLDNGQLLQAALDVRSYGNALTQMLFTEPRVLESWIAARAFAQGGGTPLRVRLCLPIDSPRLHGLRWETMTDPRGGQPLALSANILFTRYLESSSLQAVAQPERTELRALVAVASPDDGAKFGLAHIEKAAEVARATDSLGTISAKVLDGVDGRQRASLTALSSALQDGIPILYLMCHGTTVNGDPYLFLENEEGGSAYVSGRDFANLIERLGPTRRPLLVILAACHSATGAREDQTLRAVGPLLAAAGVGAIVALQDLFPLATAARLLPTFFKELHQDGQIDRAMTAARAALRPDEPWWSPALFLRLRDGRLWREPAQTARRAARVFLSYKRGADPDELLARRLDKALREIGHQVFIDQRIVVGSEWAKTIEREIDASDVLVVLLSDHAVRSEMVLKEVEHAKRCYERTGKARLLPVRVAYTERLPYPLNELLDPIHYALWRGLDDDLALVAQLTRALDQDRDLPSPGLGTSTSPVAVTAPRPYADPAFIESLSEPSGALDSASGFYIERDGDALLRRQLTSNAGSLTTIRSPRQCGKSSLLYAGLRQVVARGERFVQLDLQRSESTTLASLDALLRMIAENVVSRLRLEHAEVERSWVGGFGPLNKLTYLFEDYVLPSVQGSLTLALDEADRMLGLAYRDDFFGLLRSWFNLKASNPLWKKLRTVLVISTEPYLLIRDTMMSPFNVGETIRLHDFSVAQVRELNQRYRGAVRDNELGEMLDFLGGHPYLTHKALYTIATTTDLEWVSFARLARTERSPFNDHIRRYHWMLRDEPDLRAALQSVVRKGRCPDEIAFERLVRAGLVTGSDPEHCTARCRLYAEALGGGR